jgi:uncharacterized protein with ATP-grasp and redox domains
MSKFETPLPKGSGVLLCLAQAWCEFRQRELGVPTGEVIGGDIG